MKRTLNLGPFGIYLWGGILLVSGAVFGAGSILYSNQNTGTIYAQQLANGTPGIGKYPRGGACPTGTSIDTSTGTTDRQCWVEKIPAADINGLPNITGTTGRLPIKTTTGWGDSAWYQANDVLFADLQLNLGSSINLWKLRLFDDGIYASGLGAYTGDEMRIFGSQLTKKISLGWMEYGGAYHEGAKLVDGTLTIEGGLAVKALSGGGVGKILFQSGTDGTISAKTIAATDVGAEPTLSACAPGQAVVYTGTGTGTSTAKGCGTVTSASSWFDPLGTYYLESFPIEGPTAWHLRWAELRNQTGIGMTPYARTATCSSGSDALIGGLFVPYGTGEDGRAIWPGGDWRASLRAKVNANAAAIRIEVWDVDGNNNPTSQWFSWTTDVFSNTAYATIQKQTSHVERVLTDGVYPYEFRHRIAFKLYATCSTSTTVSVEFGDAAYTNRIESPITIDKISESDVNGLAASLAAKEASLPSGKPGQVLGYLGTGTDNTTEKGPVDREPVISGVPGQFVKFKGTGTATTTEKEAGTVLTAIATRTFVVSAADFKNGSGATAGNISSLASTWALRDGYDDYVYGAVIKIPSDYSSGLTVTPIWSPSATDSNTGHNVVWNLALQPLSNGEQFSFLSSTSWSGTACGYYCTANYIRRESARACPTVSAGTSYALYFQRYHSGGSDTYVGNVQFVALDFSYTSSL